MKRLLSLLSTTLAAAGIAGVYFGGKRFIWSEGKKSMAAKDYRYVVLGGGVAAGYAARAFVEKGLGKGELAIISEESVAPYERPALSKGFLMGNPPARLPGFHTCVGSGGERLSPEWYTEHGIDLLLSKTVTQVDPATKTLKLVSGETVQYDKLFVATGSSAVTFSDLGFSGADYRGIYCLRNIQDAQKLYDAIQAHKGKEAVVIGGGYIGMEVAAALVQNQVSCTMVFPEAHMMERLFTPEIAQFYEDFYRRQGVKILKGPSCKSFVGNENGHVTGVVLTNGTELKSELVVVGIGAKPNTKLLEPFLKMEQRGFLVNGQLQTSDSNIFAIGDVATFPLKMYDNRLARVEHVGNARQMAMHAVDVVFGSQKAYDYLPFFYSRVFDKSWKFYGDTPKDATCLVFGEMNPKLFAVWVRTNGQVVGTFTESATPEEEKKIERIARERPTVDISKLKACHTAEEGLNFFS
ncbi:Monodehydroascorbate reductase [Galdieria sulphuraria]|nr:Monodehydroascorbate reductase [Galdieria sulphuraria]